MNTDYRAKCDPKLVERIDALLLKIDALCRAADRSFAGARADYLSDKWCRIIVDTSAYAFVALIDYANKTLGAVKRGDIHRPATWKAPAKHKRGSVWADDFGNCLGAYGISYLRG